MWPCCGVNANPSLARGQTDQLAASIALHSLSLAVASEVVGTTAFVAGRRARVATIAAAEAPLETTTRATRATASTGSRWVRAVALPRHCQYIWQMPQEELNVQQGGRAGCSCSNGHWRRSDAAWDSQPGRGRHPGSYSTAWLDDISIAN